MLSDMTSQSMSYNPRHIPKSLEGHCSECLTSFEIKLSVSIIGKIQPVKTT